MLGIHSANFRFQSYKSHFLTNDVDGAFYCGGSAKGQEYVALSVLFQLYTVAAM